MRHARPKVGSARLVFEYLVLDSLVVKRLLEEVGCLQLVSGWVGRVDTQIFLQPLDCEVGVLSESIEGKSRRSQ
jgi:hypothetical protein